MRGAPYSRRKFLRTATRASALAVGAGTVGYVGYAWPRPAAPPAAHAASPPERGVDHFVSRPDLHPPRLKVTHPHRGGPAGARPRYLFLAPKGYQETGPGQQGTLIVDLHGRPVWFLPLTGPNRVPMDFKLQTYRGKPVLTWWQGTITDGHGDGIGVIYDGSYRKIAEVHAGGGLQADLHEFLLTDRDTALITAYRPAQIDTTALGHPGTHWVYAGMVQEVDVATGSVLFQWDSTDHVDLAESQGAGGDGSTQHPFDYFHINSIDVLPGADLLISSRNTWTLYRLRRTSGRVAWRLGGKRSDFALDAKARFYWQHDARMHPGGKLTLFDDGSSPPKEQQSRGLVLDIDEAAKRVHVDRQFTHPARLLADNQGSMQLLAGGGAVIGWGSEPYVSEFEADGTMILDGRFPVNDQSYRAFAFDWHGTPTDEPAVTVGANAARGVTVYVSWNGATEVARWRILAGSSPSNLRPAATAARAGFETAVVVNSDGPYFAAVALDAEDSELSRCMPARGSS